MGYGEGVKGYRVSSLDKRKVIPIKDVVLDEENILCGVNYSFKSNTYGENMLEQVGYKLDNSKEVDQPI